MTVAYIYTTHLLNCLSWVDSVIDVSFCFRGIYIDLKITLITTALTIVATEKLTIVITLTVQITNSTDRILKYSFFSYFLENKF